METISKLSIGPYRAGEGADTPLRGGKDSELIVQQLHGRYHEQASRGNIFSACNSAATAVSVALATTYTGICLSNPAGSRVNVVLLKASYALSVAPAAIAPLFLIGGYAAGGVTAHTTPLVPTNNILGSPKGTGLADAAATLVGTPAYLIPIFGGFTAATLPSPAGAIQDLEGSFIVPPGGYVAIGALTAVTGFGAIMWEEVGL